MRWWRRRADDRELVLKALEVVRDVALSQAEAVKALAAVEEARLAGFRTAAEPEGWVSRDVDEYEAEVKRLQEKVGTIGDPLAPPFILDLREMD